MESSPIPFHLLKSHLPKSVNKTLSMRRSVCLFLCSFRTRQRYWSTRYNWWRRWNSQDLSLDMVLAGNAAPIAMAAPLAFSTEVNLTQPLSWLGVGSSEERTPQQFLPLRPLSCMARLHKCNTAGLGGISTAIRKSHYTASKRQTPIMSQKWSKWALRPLSGMARLPISSTNAIQRVWEPFPPQYVNRMKRAQNG